MGADRNKILLPLVGSPVFVWSLRTIRLLPGIQQVVVVVRPDDAPLVRPHLTDGELTAPGGATRHGSEWNALQLLAPAIDAGEVDVVAIHDAARPLASAELWSDVITAAVAYGGALPAREQTGLFPVADVTLVGVQTPQAFRATPLLAAYRQAASEGFTGTDTASCLERYTDLTIAGVPAPATNLKITFPEDVALAERLVGQG